MNDFGEFSSIIKDMFLGLIFARTVRRREIKILRTFIKKSLVYLKFEIIWTRKMKEKWPQQEKKHLRKSSNRTLFGMLGI